jgi:hypothetical protein
MWPPQQSLGGVWSHLKVIVLMTLCHRCWTSTGVAAQAKVNHPALLHTLKRNPQ